MANNNPNPTRGTGGRFASAKRSDGDQAGGGPGSNFVDPDAAGKAAGEPAEPGPRVKRRDSPGNAAAGGADKAAGGAKAGKKASASLDLSAAAGLLSGFHAIVAMQRNEPHWMLSDADAARYGQALANALRHMPIKAAQKTLDYATLVMVAFVIETPRVVRSVQLVRTPKAAASRGPAPVFQFVKPGSPGPPATHSTPTNDGPGTPPIADGPPDLSAFGGEGG